MDETHWAGVLIIVTEELLLVEDKPMNTYKERAGLEDKYSILVIGADAGVIVEVSESFTLLMLIRVYQNA